MRCCAVAGDNCAGDAHFVCYGCESRVCAGCSAIRLWYCYQTGKGQGWKERPRRICDDCQEDAINMDLGAEGPEL